MPKRLDLLDGDAPESGPQADDPKRRCAELQLIVDAIPALVIYKSPDNRIVRVNRAVTAALGVGVEELRSTEAGRWFPDADAAEREARDLEVIRSGQPLVGVVERVCLPQGPRWFETDRLPQFDDSGNVTGLVIVAQDITDRRRLENQLLQAQKLESIGKLAGGVAHDFNNLLTSLFALITTAQNALPSGSEAHEYLSLMQLAAEGGANLTKQLMTFARRRTVEPRVIDLNSLVRDTADLLRRVLPEGIVLDLALTGEALPVRADPSQILQVLMNLALNARDAMGDTGRLTFRTSSEALPRPEALSLKPSNSGRFVQVSVEDTGSGFSQEAKEHLFEPFFTTKALGQGTGLGLATCYGIVKQNEGHITLESEPGEGAKLTVYFPEADAPVEERRRRRVAGPVRAGTETILLVEDDDLVRYLAVAALSTAGYRLIEACNGKEALRAAREHVGPIHLLVSDVIMPEMSGAELAREFSALYPEAAVLFVSGHPGGCPLPEGDVLSKPFTDDELFDRVRRALDAVVEGSPGAQSAGARPTEEGGVGLVAETTRREPHS